jgi:hypothetical protein
LSLARGVNARASRRTECDVMTRQPLGGR